MVVVDWTGNAGLAMVVVIWIGGGKVAIIGSFYLMDCL